VESKICQHCGREIFYETDDMITCGGAFEVWYSQAPNDKKAMSCGIGYKTHEPSESR
jgi:hypothetical protein